FALPSAAALGIRTLHLEVEAANEPATRLYRSAGLEETGRSLMRIHLHSEATSEEESRKVSRPSLRLLRARRLATPNRASYLRLIPRRSAMVRFGSRSAVRPCRFHRRCSFDSGSRPSRGTAPSCQPPSLGW